MKLFLEAIFKFLIGILLVGVLVFLPARSFSYWNGWLFMGLLFIPMFLIGIILFIKNPSLLRRRLESKEKEQTQKYVVLMSGILFLGGFILAGLDYHYQWSSLPMWSIILFSILFELSYLFYFEVLRENAYLSRTIQVEKDQKLIDTGCYGIIRHPMYASTVVLFLMIPLVLGSIYSFFLFLFYPILIVFRIRNEEEVLLKELKGYKEYRTKVKYRLIPFVW